MTTSKWMVYLVVFGMLFAVTQAGFAVLIGTEDFDGGAVNLSSTTNVFDFGAGGGSAGDVFGRVSAFFGGLSHAVSNRTAATIPMQSPDKRLIIPPD